MDLAYTVKKLDIEDLQKALALVWNVFLEFEAPDYEDEGIQEFKEFIEYEVIKEKLENGIFYMWGYSHEKTIIDVLAIRPPCHISLLSVYKQPHRKGVARMMFDEMLEYYR